MKALVVGLGGIGRRHARNLRTLDPHLRLAACRTQARASTDLGEDANLFERIDYDLAASIAWRPDLAIIATPASTHVAIALSLADAGVHLFIEKPISATLEGVERLVTACERASLILMVGYNLRFDRPLAALRAAALDGRIGTVSSVRAEVGQYLPDWRPDHDHRQTCSARPELGGGVLRELSHELDYLRWIAGDVRAVSARVGHGGGLDVEAETIADVALEFEDGIVGNVHMDMVDHAPVRRCRVVGRDGTLEWDGISGDARIFARATGAWIRLDGATEDNGAGTYVREMRHFLDRVADGEPPLVNGVEGLATLRVVLAAAESADTGRAVLL